MDILSDFFYFLIIFFPFCDLFLFKRCSCIDFFDIFTSILAHSTNYVVMGVLCFVEKYGCARERV